MNDRDILERLQAGDIDLDAAISKLKGYEDLGHSRVDINREERNGAAEVIYGEGKTANQIKAIMRSMQKLGQNILVTRLDVEKAETDMFRGNSLKIFVKLVGERNQYMSSEQLRILKTLSKQKRKRVDKEDADKEEKKSKRSRPPDS